MHSGFPHPSLNEETQDESIGQWIKVCVEREVDDSVTVKFHTVFRVANKVTIMLLGKRIWLAQVHQVVLGKAFFT